MFIHAPIFCQHNPPKSPIFINDISYLFISFKGQDNTHESSKDPSSSFLKPRLNYLVSCSTIDCQMDGSNQSNVKHYISPWNLQQDMHQWFSISNLALISGFNLLQYWTSHTTMGN